MREARGPAGKQPGRPGPEGSQRAVLQGLEPGAGRRPPPGGATGSKGTAALSAGLFTRRQAWLFGEQGGKHRARLKVGRASRSPREREQFWKALPAQQAAGLPLLLPQVLLQVFRLLLTGS